MQQILLAKFHENLTLPERVDSIFESPRRLTFECCPSRQGGSFISCELQIKVGDYSLPCEIWKSAMAVGIEENSLYTWRYSPCSRCFLQNSMKIWPYVSELIQFLSLPVVLHSSAAPPPLGGGGSFISYELQIMVGIQFPLWNMKICHGSRYWRKLSIHLKIFAMQQILLAKFHENLTLPERVDSIFESPRCLTFECCPSPPGGGSFISSELQIMVGIQFALWSMKICHGSRYWRKIFIHLKIFTTWRYSDAPCKVPWRSDLT